MQKCLLPGENKREKIKTAGRLFVSVKNTKETAKLQPWVKKKDWGGFCGCANGRKLYLFIYFSGSQLQVLVLEYFLYYGAS